MKTLITTFAFVSVLSFGIAYAKQVSVDVKTPQDQKALKAEVTNIAPDTVIDTTQAFSASDKTTVANGLNLTQGEREALDRILSGTKPTTMREAQAQISVMNKQYKHAKVSLEENTYFVKNPKDISVYFARKQLKELGI